MPTNPGAPRCGSPLGEAKCAVIVQAGAIGLKGWVYMIVDRDNPTPCVSEADLFVSPQEDGRTEIGRIEREALAGVLCDSCPIKLRCLQRALVLREPYGVWGGLGEGDRREFVTHLRSEGYAAREVPPLDELAHSLRQFYKVHYTATEKLFPEQLELVA